MKRRLLLLLLPALVLVTVGRVATVHGSATGGGEIAFVSSRGVTPSAFVMGSDGAQARRVTSPPPGVNEPAVSPDGRLVAFTPDVTPKSSQLWVARADGTNAHVLLSSLAMRSAPAWTAHGTRIGYTLRLAPKRFEVRSVALDGRGDRLELPNAQEATWSPTGALAFVRDGAVFVRPNPHAAAHVIAKGSSPAWSRDGKQLAFVRAETAGTRTKHAVAVAAADGTGLHLVTSLRPIYDGQPVDSMPVWNSAGSVLYLHCCGDARVPGVPDYGVYGFSIVSVEPDGSDRHPLLYRDMFDFTLAPDDRILQDDFIDGTLWSDPDGRHPHPFYTRPEGGVTSVAWSRDGRSLLYTMWEQLRRIDLSGAGDRVLAALSGDLIELSLSPDRTQYVANEDPLIEINDVAARKSKAILWDNGAADTTKGDPVWSPDGRTIAYIDGWGDGQLGYLDLYDVATGHKKWTGAKAVEGIAWTPDSKRIAFVRDCGRGHPLGCTGVFVRDLASRRTTHILTDASAPAWSGDGRQLAFVRGKDKASEIWRADADGSHQIRLTHNSTADVAPVWRWPR